MYSSAVEAPGELIASGRDSDIFHYGNGRVLRRSRNGRSQTNEARTMDFVRSQGYAVPEGFSVSDYGNGRVLRRSRNGRSQTNEARTMEFVRSRGYPVPEVFSVSDDGIDMVMA